MFSKQFDRMLYSYLHKLKSLQALMYVKSIAGQFLGTPHIFHDQDASFFLQVNLAPFLRGLCYSEIKIDMNFL